MLQNTFNFQNILDKGTILKKIDPRDVVGYGVYDPSYLGKYKPGLIFIEDFIQEILNRVEKDNTVYEEVVLDLADVLALDGGYTLLPAAATGKYYKNLRIIGELTKPMGTNLTGGPTISFQNQSLDHVTTVDVTRAMSSIGTAQVVFELNRAITTLAGDGLSVIVNTFSTASAVTIFADTPFLNGDSAVSWRFKISYELGTIGTEL